MRLYLDNCCLQRPFDDQTQWRVRVETEAVLAVLAAVESNEHTLVGSEALDYEVSRIPNVARRTDTQATLTLAAEYLKVNHDSASLATAFEKQGLPAMDALHLALACTARVDRFCTCDDRLLRQAKVLAVLYCPVVSLLKRVSELSR